MEGSSSQGRRAVVQTFQVVNAAKESYTVTLKFANGTSKFASNAIR